MAIDYVERARALAPGIRSARDEAERQRRTPAPLAQAIAAAGLYQLFLPRSAGGPQVDPPTAFRAIEELSKADGSIGWVAMIATDVSMLTGWLATDVVRGMCGEPANLRCAGSLRPQGRARPVPGGYRVAGQWNFASGIDIANWLYCPAVVMDGEKPQLTPAGTPRVRAMWVPREKATIVDTWSVLGMRGTGSQDFRIDDLLVPEDHSCFVGDPPVEKAPLYTPRAMLTILWAITAANALGIARGAIDSFVEMAALEASTQSTALLRDRAAVQGRIGEAEAILGAARAFVLDAVEAFWEVLSAARPMDAEIARARLAITHAIHEAVRSVGIVFHAAGTSAIHTRNPLERHFRDIHVVVQHNSAFQVHYESAGKVVLGLRPTEPGW